MTSRVVVALLAVTVLAGCGSSGGGSSSNAGGATAVAPTTAGAGKPVPTPATEPAPWPAPSDPMALAAKAGLSSEPAEVLEYHVHSHLDVFVNGTPQEVPAGLGIDTKNPAVRQFTLDNGAVGYGL